MENNQNLNEQSNENKSKNKTIVIIILIISLLLVGLAVYKLFIEKPVIDQPRNDNTQEHGNSQNESEKNNNINEQENSQNESKENNNIKIDIDELYINGKKVTGIEFSVLDENYIYDLGDLILVSDCVSSCSNYFIDTNANVVGTIGKIENYTFNALITPKYGDIEISDVKGKDIYVWSNNYNTQDASSVCGRARNEEISITEKYTYLGNKQFSNPEASNSTTVGNYIDAYNVHC